MKKVLFILIYTLVFGLLGKLIYSEYKDTRELKGKKRTAYEDALINYKKPVKYLAKKFDLSPSYLMALIMLESSGREDVPIRFEKSVYRKLLNLKKGRIKKFENLRQKDVKKLTKKQLKALASSYGPFQIMGYKSFFLEIPLDTLTGKKNMYYAVKWINLTYGDFVRHGSYKDAFHIHNAGEKHPEKGKPQTHDPDYIKNGLEYERYFREVFEDWLGRIDLDWKKIEWIDVGWKKIAEGWKDWIFDWK